MTSQLTSFNFDFSFMNGEMSRGMTSAVTMVNSTFLVKLLWRAVIVEKSGVKWRNQGPSVQRL